MKAYYFSLIVSVLFFGASTSTRAASRETLTYNVLEQGPHHRQVQATNDAGQIITEFVELSTGMSVWSDKEQRWLSSSAEFNFEADIISANNAQHKVNLSYDADDDTRGVVDLEMPDGNHLQLKTIGIALTKSDNSKSIFISKVRQSPAVLMDPTTVIYSDAFFPVAADIRIRNSLAGLESDIMLREKLSPADYGFDPKDCKIEVWTRLIHAVPPKISTETIADRLAGQADVDDQIKFATMAFGRGSAFRLDHQKIGGADISEIRVGKEIVTVNGKDETYLIESVPFMEAAKYLDALPANHAQIKPAELEVASATPSSRGLRQMPTSLASNASALAPRVQSASLPKAHFSSQNGYVIDYQIINTGLTDYTFKGDTTYFIQNAVLLSGLTTLEGGTVIKMATNAKLELQGALNCNTGPYRPAIISCADDQTVGDPVTSNPQAAANAYYGTYGLRFNNNLTGNYIHHVFVRQALTGISFAAGSGGEIRHAQVVNCSTGIESSSTLKLRNLLIYNIGTLAIKAISASVNADYLTIDNVPTCYNGTGSATISLNDSILYRVTTTGLPGGSTYATATASTFVSAAGGSHYLSSSDTLARNKGSSPSEPPFVDELKTMTTSAPTIKTGTQTTSLVLGSFVPGDPDQLDYGYHYDVVDWVLNGFSLQSCQLTLSSGVRVAWKTPLIMAGSSSVVVDGRVKSLIQMGRIEGFQENPTDPKAGKSFFTIQPGTTPLPTISMRLAEIHGLANDRELVNTSGSLTPSFPIATISLADMIMHNVRLYYYPDTGASSELSGKTTKLSLINNLLDRCTLGFYKTYTSQDTDLRVTARNNLFRGGLLEISYSQGSVNPIWELKDNLFDKNISSVATSPSPSPYLSLGYNAFTIGTTDPFPIQTGDWLNLTADFATAGPLGSFYYPLGGPLTGLARLIGSGSRTAGAAGLYQHTVRIDQAKEVTGQVSIGFHYIALAGQNPMDTDRDGGSTILRTSTAMVWWIWANRIGTHFRSQQSSMQHPGSTPTRGWLPPQELLLTQWELLVPTTLLNV